MGRCKALLYLAMLMPVLLGSSLLLPAQPGIEGRLVLDTSKWAPVAYLSLIPDFGELNTISYENIIDRTPIGPDGEFRFPTGLLSSEDRLYRIHLSKKGDPAASLIIGGREQNHFFLIANQKAGIQISSGAGRNLFNHLKIEGYAPNTSLLEISQIASLLDTLDYFGSSMNREFIREAVADKLKSYADTCSHQLVAQYALYKSGKEADRNRNWWIGALLIAVFSLSSLALSRIRRKRPVEKKNSLSDLTVQERKIFALLQEGKSNKEIADDCAISVSTVKSHVNNIYSKLQVSSRKEILDLQRGSSTTN